MIRRAPLLRLADKGISLAEVNASWSFADVVDMLEYLDLQADLREIRAEEAQEE